jgi:hypothetical protein
MDSHVRQIRYSEYPIQTGLAALHFTVRFAPNLVDKGAPPPTLAPLPTRDA